ncbi:4'-phosphopantetheinyl transferase [Bacillus pseudomycoides]|uniref:4'-phosphopantetheinyl transferase n=1 Tax=Bacillus pseudomycoides TaxID=64104 RepID=A0AA91VGI5_9BACI|nr:MULTISPECIES: 4'-phosphopantetheinyl transferase superfamily protein [Bacillus]PEB50560.1 4'-phosphopantetheinyl transferase [Bacillus sp. AFS098217]PED84659.1 4'-phosphopantetheinyl transferase [Bacillus pseudomycoides]PEU07046.1 4'-phosphopantetheinyl transferase [Bacillus sp. AFS019443]PEU18356.1 4'-phosphopantetheinyl transferase [Bacillus sp. AFS014408]PFW60525.1 4'-phosphopantetheinyl transferase [Bacillus sp. AFS075034]
MKVFALHIDRLLQSQEFNYLMGRISVERVNKIQKLIFREDQHRMLLSEIFIRSIIHRECKLPDEKITFQFGPYGKPCIEDVPSFHFNLSHSDSWIVCATDCHPIGIDIEKISPINYSLAKHFFSDQEYRDLMSKKEAERLSYFYDLWTIKESFVKQLGTGLSFPMNSFSISIDLSQKVHLKTDEKKHSVHIQTIHIDNAYKAAVCSYEEARLTEITYISLEELLI